MMAPFMFQGYASRPPKPRGVRVIAALSALATLCAPCAGSRPASAAHAMVVTEQHYATQAGVDILKEGGNAIDAAVAVAYALAVVHPCCGNIGGGGFILARMHDGRERFIDFREKAPLRARANMYLDTNGNVVPNASTRGYLAAGVPGTVMGLERARSELGTMTRAHLMMPAIRLARDGFQLVPRDVAILRSLSSTDANVRAIFMPGGQALRAGDTLRQPQLAATLELISAGGANAFYRGSIARTIAAQSAAHGGILTMADFAAYTVDESQPVHCSYRGYRITSAPPPSSGGVTLCEILDVLQPYPFSSWGWSSTSSVHYVTEAERRAFADRNAYLGDPAFVQNPVRKLLDAAYITQLRASISADKATPSGDVHPGLGAIQVEKMQTTHFSIVDRFGNAVALTYTINDGFGAQVIAGDTGFFLNDEMDDFTSKAGVPNTYGLVQGAANAIAPGKRPLSSMTPTIVTKQGDLFMVTGSPGGARIITIVLSTLQGVIDYGMNVQQAVDAPRTHMQWLPDQLLYEPGAFSDTTASELQTMGYTLWRSPVPWGEAQAIVVDAKSGMLYGGSDRRDSAGLAEGY